MKNLTSKINSAYIEAYTGDSFPRNAHRLMWLKAKKAFKEGKYSSMSEARASVPSVKLIKSCRKALNQADTDEHEMLNWSKEEIERFLA